MTAAQRAELQQKLDEFVFAYLLASREKDGLPADRLFWVMMVRERIEQQLDNETWEATQSPAP